MVCTRNKCTGIVKLDDYISYRGYFIATQLQCKACQKLIVLTASKEKELKNQIDHLYNQINYLVPDKKNNLKKANKREFRLAKITKHKSGYLLERVTDQQISL